jgi:hypothetical protein
MVDLGEGAPAMMYRREAPKPVREPGFILPLIGCGCMYRRYQLGTQSISYLYSIYVNPGSMYNLQVSV